LKKENDRSVDLSINNNIHIEQKSLTIHIDQIIISFDP